MVLSSSRKFQRRQPRRTRRIQNSDISTNIFITLKQIAGLFEENFMRRFKMEPWNSLKSDKRYMSIPFLKHKDRAVVSVVIHGSASDADMDEPVAASSTMTPAAIKTLPRNPRFQSLFNQLGLNPEACTTATKAIMAIAADSGAHCFIVETHARSPTSSLPLGHNQ